ncbi:MAG: TIGR02710 family CRISPR-associated CARF protein, partial [Desulfobacterales bacterium]|nr:TIGR02710 family CRISPR-associated CARF protein [Desulfobacterales bacterium]
MAKAMIITVGGTPPPIIKSICEYKPEFVSFFASQDTSDSIKAIKDETLKKGVIMKSELTLADDVNDLFHCHSKADEAVRRVLDKGYNKDDVIVDYTGGTKNMSVALALAAITHGFCFSYVGGKERTKNGIGIVVNGQEKVYSCINPWDFLAVEEKKKIALLFNQYQFKAAKELIDALCAKNIKNKSLFKTLGIMVDGYHKWDLFRHKDAIDRFERAKIDEIKHDADVKIQT